MKKRRHLRHCAICGNIGASTDDHLPPQSLYPTPLPNKEILFSVPACKNCNNGASTDDEEFKIAIGVMRGGKEPSSDLLDSLQATLNNNARLDRLVKTGSPTWVFDAGTMRTGPVKIMFSRQRYEKVVSRIIKGLYWRETGNSLGKETYIEVIDQASLSPEREKTLRELLLQPGLKRGTLNAETVVYKYFMRPDGQSFWALYFFSTHAVFGFAAAPMESPFQQQKESLIN